MVKRHIFFLVFVGITGCGSGEVRPEAVSLKEAGKLEAEGRTEEAAFTYARLLIPLQERDDFQAHLARARIFDHLARLQVRRIPEFRTRFPWMIPYLGDNSQAALMSKSARESVHVVSEVSSEEARTECSSRIARLFLSKVENPSQRLRSIGNPCLEKILFLEVAGIYESYHLSLVPSASRECLEKIFRLLSEAYQDLSELEGARSFARDRWREISKRFLRRIHSVGEEEPAPPRERWEKRLLHLNLRQHLREGTYWADRATVERTSKGDKKQCERAYRNSLRHLVFVGEILPGEESEFENVLSSMPIVFRGWETACFEKP